MVFYLFSSLTGARQIAPSSTYYFPSEAGQQYHQEIVNLITGDYVSQLLNGIDRLTVPPNYTPAAQSPEIGRIIRISGTILGAYFEQLFTSGYSEHTVPGSSDQTFAVYVADPACEFKATNSDPGNGDTIMNAVRLTVTLTSFSITSGRPE